MILGILGTGNMAEALIAGLTKKGVLSPKEIWGTDVSAEKLRDIKKRTKIQTTLSAKTVLEKADTLLLAVKPQQLGELLDSLKDSIHKKHLILSIAAGIEINFISKRLGGHSRIIRLMPNTPALLSLGATGLYAHPSCSAQDKKTAQKIFGAVGLVEEASKESLLDAITGLSGSGPAYVYTFIQGLIEGGIKAGLKPATAKKLALQTIKGATALVEASGEETRDLIAKVASKGGTTEAGLKVLTKKKIIDTIIQCIQAATRRAEELRRLIT